ncbi:hypothetical protein pb186bvf_010422 [Paramecium bursaria]
MDYHYCFKFIIIGDTSVGKSCILYQFLEQKFRTKHEMTVGVEFGAKMMEIQNKRIKIQVWDTAGQEAFKSITRQYYKSAAGAILVYDITRKESFENIKDWIKECTNYGTSDLKCILIGNKNDLEKDRKVSKADGEQLAKENGFTFLEVSAKTNYNVNNVFYKLAEEIVSSIHQKREQQPNVVMPGVRLGLEDKTPQKPVKSGCC